MATFNSDIYKKRQDLIPQHFFGRTELKIANRDLELTEVEVASILNKLLPTHFKNRYEINELRKYLIGIQDIYGKLKIIRPEINHMVVENNAYDIVEFKKGYIFGEPIQYIQRSDVIDEELQVLNDLMLDNNKSGKDKDLSEDLYVGGQAYRIVLPKDREDLPVIIENLDNRDTFVVYGNDIEKTKLLGGTIYPINDETVEIMVYTKSNIFYYQLPKTDLEKRGVSGNTASGNEVDVKFIKKSRHTLKKIPIIEYVLNKNRIGLIELVKGSLDALNFITSSDLDDIDQFIQSLLVFLNQDIDIETFKGLLEVGGVSIKSTDPRLPADVKLLVNKLDHADTKVLYDRILHRMLNIVGVPQTGDKASMGDTAQARMIGEGWTMAEERAKQDELAFKVSEREMVSLVIDICKNKKSVGIQKLNPRDIEIKFTRNRSDNLLVKTQALMNLRSAQVSPELAFQIVGLFSDAQEAVKMSKTYFGEGFWKEDSGGVIPPVDENEVVNE